MEAIWRRVHLERHAVDGKQRTVSGEMRAENGESGTFGRRLSNPSPFKDTPFRKLGQFQSPPVRSFYVLTRPQKVFAVCAAIFLTALVIAEATAGKFFTAFHLPSTLNLLGVEFDRVIMTAGVIAFPITFIVTDVMNEYFGKRGIRFVTMLGVAMVVFEFLLIQAALAVPTDPISPVPDEAFTSVFGTTTRVIFGSLVAFIVGQFADISLFHWLRKLTAGKHLWLRATGSTFGSQLLDTFIVLTVAFAGQLPFAHIVAITLFNYGYKLVIAIVITPLIYAGHWGIDRYLGDETAWALIERAKHDEVGLPAS